MNLRKISLTKETILADAGKPTAQPITRAVAVAVFANPYAGRYVEDLSPLFAQGTEWGGVCFAVYNVVCFLIAFMLPSLAKATSRKAVHMIALVCGGIGLISVLFITNKWMLFASMAGV